MKIFTSGIWVAICSTTFAAEPAAPTVKFSGIESLRGSAPMKTEHFEIAETVKISGPYYVFDVKADHGEYEAESVAKLTKVCHEIRAIEEYRATPEGESAWKGAKDHLGQIGQGAKAIVKNPRESAKLSNILEPSLRFHTLSPRRANWNSTAPSISVGTRSRN